MLSLSSRPKAGGFFLLLQINNNSMSTPMERGIIYFEVVELIPHKKIVAIISHNNQERKKHISPLLHKDFETTMGKNLAKAAKSLHMEAIAHNGKMFFALIIDFEVVRPDVDMMYELSIWLEKKILPLCNITGTYPLITKYKEQLLLIRKISPEPF
jgi:hypothetical protein